MAIPDSVRQEILAMAATGEFSPHDIATQQGVSVATVYNLVREAGLLTKRKTTTDSIDVKQVIIDYQDTKNSVREVLERYLISYGTLYTILRDNNVPVRVSNRLESYKNQVEAAIAMYEHGARIMDITRETGIGSYKLYTELYKRGLGPRRKVFDTVSVEVDVDVARARAETQIPALRRIRREVEDDSR